MALVSLALKASYGKELPELSDKIMTHVKEMAKIFYRFDEIEAAVDANVDFSDEEKTEIIEYMNNCYRVLMYASLGAHDIPGVGGVPIEIWDEVGIDVRPILAAAGKYVYPTDSTSEIVVE